MLISRSDVFTFFRLDDCKGMAPCDGDGDGWVAIEDILATEPVNLVERRGSDAA